MEEVKYQLSCKCCKSKFTKSFPMFSGDACPVCRSKNTVAKELKNNKKAGTKNGVHD